MSMPKRSSKKRKSGDINVLATHIVEEATSKPLPDVLKTKDGKNAYAVALGRLGGKKGGRARAEKLTSEQRTAIARHAAETRWAARKK